MAVVTTCHWQIAQLAMKEVMYSETMILAMRRHGRQGQERVAAAENRETVRHQQQAKTVQVIVERQTKSVLVSFNMYSFTLS